jgi:predicted phosphodiesterase
VRIAVRGPQRHIAYYDAHVPHNIDFTQILDFQKFYKPTHIVIGGDFLNMESCSHWNEGMFKEVGFGRLRANILGEMSAGQDLLCRIRCASPHAEIYYIPGNHENHVFWAAQHYPALGIATHVDTSKINFKCDMARAGNDATAAILEDMLKTEALKIHVLPYNEELTIGKITYLHGHQLSVSNSQRLYPGANIVYGHYHTDNLITLNDSGDGQVKQHRAVPCMTHLGPQKPGYLKSKSTRWLNGLWLAEVLPNGLFDGRVKKVLGGKVMVP